MASTSTQQPNVVQAILDSLTRCFNPSDGDESNRCPHQAGCVFGGDKQSNGGRRSSSGGRGSDKGSSDNLKAQYDADRYIHRKLEIFRTSEEDLAKLGIINSSPRKKQQQRGSRHRRERSANSPNTLICSSSDEIANLAKSHKSAAAQGPGGQPNGAQNGSNPIADFVNLLRDPFGCLSVAQQPFGLCFATPIRTASIEDVSKLSDWKLTAQEFEAREQRLQEERLKEKFGGTQLDIPDVDESSASNCEDEETITSASYFDQKYSHVVETNPPMPLFREQRVAVSEYEKDELVRMMKRREGKGGSSPPRKKGSKSSLSRPPTPSSPHNPAGGSPGKRRMWRMNKSRATTSKSANRRCNDAAQAPIGKSSSVSTTQSAEDLSIKTNSYRGGSPDSEAAQMPRQMMLQEPDIVYSTAEI